MAGRDETHAVRGPPDITLGFGTVVLHSFIWPRGQDATHEGIIVTAGCVLYRRLNSAIEIATAGYVTAEAVPLKRERPMRASLAGE